MPDYRHIIVPLLPLPSTREDISLIRQLGELSIESETNSMFTVSFLGTSSEIAAIAIVTYVEEALKPSYWEVVSEAFDFALMAVRAHGSTKNLPYDVGHGPLLVVRDSSDPTPKLDVHLEATTQGTVDIDSLIETLRSGFEHRGRGRIAALCAESRAPSIPPHYAILSLCRAAELLWPTHSQLGLVLDTYEDSFTALGLSDQKFRNALPRIRNRCAHGQGRGRGDADPFWGYGLNSPLRPLVVLLDDIVTSGLSRPFFTNK